MRKHLDLPFNSAPALAVIGSGFARGDSQSLSHQTNRVKRVDMLQGGVVAPPYQAIWESGATFVQVHVSSAYWAHPPMAHDRNGPAFTLAICVWHRAQLAIELIQGKKGWTGQCHPLCGDKSYGPGQRPQADGHRAREP